MQKFRFFLLFVLLPSLLFAQQRTQVRVISFEVTRGDTKTNITRLQKPIFEHDGAILSCDSARYWKDLNYFEAFGNVHIVQDTVNIYSDLLNYDGNAKIAHLIRNVVMKDPSSTLTTNVFDYNMATRVGTYVNNGKIVNKEAQVVSKRGYYFANSRDAYFRYDVVVTTEQATIKSDTLRYNTFSNEAYFYGPTNIKGKDDNLYTENGRYNTKTERAFFGKKNLYTQGSKSLKGDSLYYDGKLGYGKAIGNIFFSDTTDKLEMYGQLGEYFKIDERVLVTKNAYVGIGSTDSVTIADKRVPDSLWLGADTLEAKMVLQSALKILPRPVVLADDEVGTDDEKEDQKSAPSPGTTLPKPAGDKSAVTEKKVEGETTKTGKDPDPKNAVKKTELIPPKKLDSLSAKPDSIQIKLDSNALTLKTDSIQLAQKLDLAKKEAKTVVKDTLAKKKDSTTVQDKSKVQAAISNIKTATAKAATPKDPTDTVKTRTIKAFNNVRVFKTNLQAKADSLFFTAADSTLRLYNNPIVWSDSTQQSGDTIHVQFKNKKINNVQILNNGFIADQESDTTKFNQIKGKIITAFFNEGEIRSMYVDGNAESIAYDKKNDGSYQFNQTVSARIKIMFEDKDIASVKTVKGIEGIFSPPEKLGKENLLTGFVWKPELRPKSKADVITSPVSSAAPPAKKVEPKKTPTTSKTPSPKKPAAKTSTKTNKPVIKAPAKNETKGDTTKVSNKDIKTLDTATKQSNKAAQ